MAEKVCAVSAHSLHGEVRWHNVAVMLATRIGCAVARLERRTKSFVMWRFSECEFAVRLVGSAICRAFAFLVILSAFSAGAKSFGSQDNKELGRIEGKISATSGEPIAGALVALVDKDGEKKNATKSNIDGVFVLRDAPEGTYALHVDKAGWTSRVVDALRLSSGETKH